MLELINTVVAYWHWIVFGLLLITLELFAPIFVTLWLGVAAIIVGICLLIIPTIGISAQLLIWVLLSAGFIALWHKYVSPKLRNQTLAGLSREAVIGQIGLVIHFTAEQSRGKLRFSAPIIGNDEWEFICDDTLDYGDKVKVVDISGNHLIVKHSL